MSHGPVWLVLRGEAGIGKTALLEVALRDARSRGHLVLSCRAVESEARVGMAALADLVEDAGDHALDSLPAPARRVLEVALLQRQPRGPPPEVRAVGAATLGLLRELGRRAPVLICIDDVHWLDATSVAVLRFALRRLETEPVGTLVALRSERPRGVPPPLDELPRGAVDELHVGPLSVEAIRQLIRAQLSATFLRPAMAQVHRQSGGNPLFALEIARALLARREPLVPGEPLPVPDTFRELVSGRLAALPATTRRSLLAVAALAAPTVAVIGAALGSRAVAALDAAQDAEVLTVEAGRVRFTHPLLASVVYADAAAAKRRTMHRALAPSVPDLEERARHLALAAAGPDGEVAEVLEEAAVRARARGAPEAAAELAELSRDLTPHHDDEDARRRAIQAADHHAAAGETARGRELLEGLVAATAPGPARAGALWRLGALVAEVESLPEGRELYEQALREAGGDPEMSADIHLAMHLGSAFQWESDRAATHAAEALRFAERSRDPSRLAQALAANGRIDYLAGRRTPGRTVARALRLEREAEGVAIDLAPSNIFGYQRLFAGDLDGARELIVEVHRRAVEGGLEPDVSTASFFLALLELLAGDWPVARSHAAEAVRLSRQTDVGLNSSLQIQAMVEAYLGNIAMARESALESLELSEAHGDVSRPVQTLGVLGFVELSLGHPIEAHGYLADAAARIRARGLWTPMVMRFLPDHVEALVALGQIDEAGFFVERLEERRAALDARWAVPAASRCRGLIQLARGDAVDGLSSLRLAARGHDELGQPFEAARSHLALGAGLRRERRRAAAREALTRARSTFDRLGAVLWADRARREIERVGGRPAAPEGMTPTEARVAELVAAGHTNQEAAAELFISVKTVEGNLSRVYRKLGVRSRTELARRLAEEPPAASEA